MTLTDFLLARIAEDEEVARHATPGPWYWEEPSGDPWPQSDESLLSRVQTPEGNDTPVLTGWGYDASGINAETADRAHIARHDPARVLAECEAKRRMVARHAPDEPFCSSEVWDDTTHAQMPSPVCPNLALLALPYADHPDYRKEWRL